MQFAVRGQSLDGGDLCPIRLDGEERAGFYRLAVDMHNASAALTGVAAYMSACEAELIAQELDKQRAALDIAGGRFAVHGH